MIEFGNVKCYSSDWFPPNGYTAITLFGRIIFKCSEEDLYDMKGNPQLLRIFNHERIHILQGSELGWIVFYTLYLFYYLKNRIHHPHHEAYRMIPFEREAYENEDNFEYNESKWELYK